MTAPGNVMINIYDAGGRLVRSLVSGVKGSRIPQRHVERHLDNNNSR